MQSTLINQTGRAPKKTRRAKPNRIGHERRAERQDSAGKEPDRAKRGRRTQRQERAG